MTELENLKYQNNEGEEPQVQLLFHGPKDTDP